MAGVGWSLVNAPSPCLWILPNTDLARSFSKTRWQPFVQDSAALRAELPDRSQKFTNLEQHFLRATINFSGSNSPAQLSSRPVRILVADEIDKFARATEREAAALDLAEQRTKAYSSSKIFRSSSPTIVEGEIWQRYLRGDRRRFFLPCIHCRTFITLDWANVKWDQGAKLSDGTWDMARVRASARYECQHCKTAINDSQKLLMMRRGEWRATNQGALQGERSYQLSSLYSPDRKCFWGSLCVRFLQDKDSLLGLQSWINGYLAEPWENQESRQERVELISPPDAPALPESVPLMTVDVQAVSPYFWIVIRSWSKMGDSRLIAAAHADDWETIRRLQEVHGVLDHHVLIDSGHRTADVYEHCLRWGKPTNRNVGLPTSIGWIPGKGRDRAMQWIDRRTGQHSPFFYGSAAVPPNRRIHLPLLEFASDYFLDILWRLRRRMTGERWELQEFPIGTKTPGAVLVSEDEYRRQMDAKVLKPFSSPRTGRVEHRWVLRSSKWPDHILDCEIMQLPWAMAHRRLAWKRGQTE
jgi:hypothetical protein